jgi:chemotaxis protein methyltransferase CheR
MSGMSPHKLSAFGELLGEHLGLRFTPDRKELERSLAHAARDAGFERPEAYVDHILARGMDESRVRSLAWHLTVGETYFFRGEAAFALFERDILPSLIAARRRGTRQLRIWSAGCASGEEPYSLAIILDRLLPDIADWRITILGTDLNTRRLAKAERGVYGEWSFRDVPPSVREQCFTRVGEEGWAVAPRIKRMVDFSYLNLATGAYPALATNTTAMDVILCRNVLMYLQPEVIKSVAGRLHGALSDGGYLLVTPSEASPEYFPQFVRKMERGEIYFRKDTATAQPTAVRVKTRIAARAAPSPAEPAPGPAAGEPDAAASRRDLSAAPTPDPGEAARLAEAARGAANRGDLEEALSACEHATTADKYSAELWYLRATILDEMARPQDALQALRSSLYLDADLVVAHFLLGSIARREGRGQVAITHLQRALELLQRLAPDELVPAADGLTASELARIAQSLVALEVTS